MDIFLFLGIITGFLAIVVGMIVKGTDVAVLLNPAAAIIILVGTFAAVMNSFPKKDFLKIPKIVSALFSEKVQLDPIDIVKQIVTMAQATRKNGLLSLEQEIEKMDNKFLKKGLGMVVDGIDPDYIKEVLEIEIDSLEERHRVGASVFTTAGGSAPTLGVLGAVIGLIGALANINDVEKLVHMIAAAFVATLYGIFFGYVIFHPFATRLKRKSGDEVNKMYIMLEGILSIQSGDNPKSIEIKLSGMLEPKDRERYENQSKGE
ncbi:flagellar motor stator protein MotA [Clostridium intestinale]|uniref:flagellar motor stator protein MotA n=1 Tax=Clostridium intestinale TaxID=36845 RepID=UPI002DD6B0E1|nr:flagellar motor stator protein MotA [Clostridium intestinale]WRY52093.1 flagellar motor stator protein MotA [Clostridium intestinale]